MTIWKTRTMAKISEEALAKSLEQFRAEVDIALKSVGNNLMEKRYVEAADTMNTLSQRMAKTNLAVRAALIQGGYIDTQ